jgi:hypothetical protein
MADLAAAPRGKRAWNSFALSSGQFVWLMRNLCKLNGVYVDATRLLERFRPPHDREQLVSAMRANRLHAGLMNIRGEKLEQTLLPVVAFPREVLGTEESPDYRGAGLIVGLIGDRFLFVEAESEAPRLRMKRNFLEFFEPMAILGARSDAQESSAAAMSAMVARPSEREMSGRGAATPTAPSG